MSECSYTWGTLCSSGQAGACCLALRWFPRGWLWTLLLLTGTDGKQLENQRALAQLWPGEKGEEVS